MDKTLIIVETFEKCFKESIEKEKNELIFYKEIDLKDEVKKRKKWLEKYEIQLEIIQRILELARS